MTEFSSTNKKPATAQTPPQEPATTEAPQTNGEIQQPKYDKEVLLRIFDDILFSSEYSEDVTIRGKLRVTFKTRTADEISKISKLLDITSANWITTLNEQRSLMNLYYALTSYQGQSLVALSQKEREDFINKLPGPIVGALITALGRFDNKVYQACQEGEENF